MLESAPVVALRSTTSVDDSRRHSRWPGDDRVTNRRGSKSNRPLIPHPSPIVSTPANEGVSFS